MGRVPDFDRRSRGPIQRAFRWTAKSRFGGWVALIIANRIDPYLMRVSRGLLKMPSGAPTVLLSHTGAKSGSRAVVRRYRAPCRGCRYHQGCFPR